MMAVGAWRRRALGPLEKFSASVTRNDLAPAPVPGRDINIRLSGASKAALSSNGGGREQTMTTRHG